MVGRLEPVALREVWKNEAKNFTSWLENHLDILAEQIDYQLTLLEKEKPAGTFSADIFAEGPDGETVVIENQLEKTDHDHLGKLITYLSNLEAKTAIWITSNPRPEHKTAINWLNEISPSDTFFYLIQVEAYKIGESEPAPLFTVVCGPSPEAKEAGEKKEELAERNIQRLEFWKELIEKANIKTKLHSNVSPSKDNWIAAGAGKSGLGWVYAILMNYGKVELVIDRGIDKKVETDNFFNILFEKKSEIEESFGGELIWDRAEGRRVCIIRSISKVGGLKDRELWEQIQNDMIDKMIRLEKTLKTYITKI